MSFFFLKRKISFLFCPIPMNPFSFRFCIPPIVAVPLEAVFPSCNFLMFSSSQCLSSLRSLINFPLLFFLCVLYITPVNFASIQHPRFASILSETFVFGVTYCSFIGVQFVRILLSIGFRFLNRKARCFIFLLKCSRLFITYWFCSIFCFYFSFSITRNALQKIKKMFVCCLLSMNLFSNLCKKNYLNIHLLSLALLIKGLNEDEWKTMLRNCFS